MKTLLLIDISAHRWGYILLFIGILIEFFIGSRRFNRRGLGGLQHYHSFTEALITTFIEFIFCKIGWLIILLGLFIAIPW